jgi:hypothetical protein
MAEECLRSRQDYREEEGRRKKNELIRLQFVPETLQLTKQLETKLPTEQRIEIEKRLRVLEYLSLPRY